VKVKMIEKRDRSQWHKWFAWYPVKCADLPGFYVWLEPVWRKFVIGYGFMPNKWEIKRTPSPLVTAPGEKVTQDGE